LAEELPEKDDQAVIERTCRIVMDVRVHISRIVPENVAGYFTPDETGEGLSWEWAERQNRLLSALLKDEESLDQALVGIVRCALELLVDSKQAGDDGADEEEGRLFERVFSKMHSEDARYFREAMRDGLLSENIYLLDKAFVINWREALIKGVFVAEQENAREGQTEARDNY
jgi:hypothetical protein